MTTCRLVGVVSSVALLVAAIATDATAARRGVKERQSRPAYERMPVPGVPLIFRASAGTTWVQVHPTGTSPCDSSDLHGASETKTVDDVWCFEGANGDSTWPAVPAAQNTGSKHETFDHWSRFAPPKPPGSKWHVTERHPGETTGAFNAWAGCDSLGGNPACDDMAFWVFKDGYGANWNYSLELDMAGQDATLGATLVFDLRYDTECNYDYLYLEYHDTPTDTWKVVLDEDEQPAIFNGVSGKLDHDHGGSGRACGDDYFGHSDQEDQGGGPININGNSIWLSPVTFPLPAKPQGLKIRWRAFSDVLWCDADGDGDTDGLGAIDNVTVTFNSSGSVVTDDFETGNFHGVSATIGTAEWIAGGLEGCTYDGWHLQFNPKYTNRGNTCEFSDDWMWAAKPADHAIPESGFSFFLASPVIDCDGWTGGVLEYSDYSCMPEALDDYTDTLIRVYDAAAGGWSLWANFDDYVLYSHCDFWNLDNRERLTPYLGPEIDSLQVCWEVLDQNYPGDWNWGMHGSVQYLVDNVSIGSFEASATVFTARAIDLFTDTFSRCDPAHTSQLANAELADWIGSGGRRTYVDADSLAVQVTDIDGITAGNVELWWRRDSGPGTSFGPWGLVTMSFADPIVTSPTDEGTYRAILGKDDGGPEDMTPADDHLIWEAGTTVEYYVLAKDDLDNEATFPTAAGDPTDPDYFEFSILPFGNTSAEQDNKLVLFVDDFNYFTLDFESSAGFDPAGGSGAGAFGDPEFVPAEDLYEDALADLGLVYDKFDVIGSGSSAQAEPNGPSYLDRGLGGYMNDVGQPAYDVLIWIQGSLGAYAFADTTRIELKTYLDNGGRFFTCGDNIAYDLGTGGNNTDSTVQFLAEYLGTSFPNSVDNDTDHRFLNVEGEPGTSLEGLLFGLYGECPVKQDFDRLTLLDPTPLNSANAVLARYTAGGAGDEGRPAVIRNVRYPQAQNPGVAVLAAFDLTRLLSRDARACFLARMLGSEFGMSFPGSTICTDTGVGAPVSSVRGFELAAASPSPFGAATGIRFRTAARAHVSIAVFNVLGRRVRTLVDEVLEPDAHVVEWDGRTDGGGLASSGIYFVRMTAGDFRATRKAVLLR